MAPVLAADLEGQVVVVEELVVHSCRHDRVDHPSNNTWDILDVHILDTLSSCPVDVGIDNCIHKEVWLH